MDRPHLLATLENLHGPPLRESRIGAWATFLIVRRPKISDQGKLASRHRDTPDIGRNHDDQRLESERHTPNGKTPLGKQTKKGRVAGKVY